jgi:hypothetical protein
MGRESFTGEKMCKAKGRIPMSSKHYDELFGRKHENDNTQEN